MTRRREFAVPLLLALEVAGCGGVERPAASDPVSGIPQQRVVVDRNPGLQAATTTEPLERPGRPAFAEPALMPARYLRSLEHSPLGYSANVSRGRAPLDTELLLGDLLFHSPHTLGPRARQKGVSCQTCHPNGAAHVDLFIESASDRPGNVDLTSPVFRPDADDGRNNPINIPSLRGCRYTAPYGRDGSVASLPEFIQHVVTREFDGSPLDALELRALTRYVRDLDLLPNRNLDSLNHLTEQASQAARRGAQVFREPRPGFQGQSCASCHPASSFFRDGLSHRLGTDRPPSPHAMEGGYETPTLLGLTETAPYFHDGRFQDLAQVVAWFDQSFELGLGARERDDLVEYLKAVGAVDRPRDDRPLALRLDHVFAYASLLEAGLDGRIWVLAIDAILAVLEGEPKALSPRVRDLEVLLERWRTVATRNAPLQPLKDKVPALRQELARLAADWAGAVAKDLAPRAPAEH